MSLVNGNYECLNQRSIGSGNVRNTLRHQLSGGAVRTEEGAGDTYSKDEQELAMREHEGRRHVDEHRTLERD